MAAAAFLTFAVVAAALFTFAVVVMVVAVGTGGDELPPQVGVDRFVGAALRTGDDRDPGLRQRVHGTAAQAAADQDVDGIVREEACQGAVTDSVGSDDLTGDDFAVLDIIDLEILSSSEMLENIPVVIGCCNFHV